MPHVAVAQSTKDIDWDHLELRVYSTTGEPAAGYVAPPGGSLRELAITRGADGNYLLNRGSSETNTGWRLTHVGGDER
jgi:hypothetical protein